jgi:hypothetical protein
MSHESTEFSNAIAMGLKNQKYKNPFMKINKNQKHLMEMGIAKYLIYNA